MNAGVGWPIATTIFAFAAFVACGRVRRSWQSGPPCRRRTWRGRSRCRVDARAKIGAAEVVELVRLEDANDVRSGWCSSKGRSLPSQPVSSRRGALSRSGAVTSRRPDDVAVAINQHRQRPEYRPSKLVIVRGRRISREATGCSQYRLDRRCTGDFADVASVTDSSLPRGRRGDVVRVRRVPTPVKTYAALTQPFWRVGICATVGAAGDWLSRRKPEVVEPVETRLTSAFQFESISENNRRRPEPGSRSRQGWRNPHRRNP